MSAVGALYYGVLCIRLDVLLRQFLKSLKLTDAEQTK